MSLGPTRTTSARDELWSLPDCGAKAVKGDAVLLIFERHVWAMELSHRQTRSWPCSLELIGLNCGEELLSWSFGGEQLRIQRIDDALALIQLYRGSVAVEVAAKAQSAVEAVIETARRAMPEPAASPARPEVGFSFSWGGSQGMGMSMRPVEVPHGRRSRATTCPAPEQP